MNDLAIFKKIKKYSKLSLIFSILIIVMFVVVSIFFSFVVVVGTKQDLNTSYNDYNSLNVTLIGIVSFLWFITILFGILIFIFNVIVIVKACSLEKSNDKQILVIMSVLGIFFLGAISNIVALVISKKNIEILSREEQIIDEPTTPIGPNVY